MSKERMLDTYLRLLDEAVQHDPIIANTFKSFKIQKNRLPRLTEDELKEEMKAFGESVSDKYKEPKKKALKLPEQTVKLIQFILNNIKDIREFIPDCKPPLRPGDLTFDDIAGNEEIKEDIRKNYIFPFRYPGLFKNKSKGILLYGPPGTGKTLLARAATAAIPKAAFFAPTPGELKGKYEGETEKNIDKLFKCAQQILKKKDSPYRISIIFIDEFDSLASSRGDDPGMRRSVNALLQAIDGIKTMPNVSVIAATNLPWSIDGSIRRRFSAEIFVDLPDTEAREFLIRQQIKNNFSIPGIEIDIYEEESWNFSDLIFSGISKYGEDLCKVSEDIEIKKKRWIGTTYTVSEKKTFTRLVDAKYVSSQISGSLLNRTGPNEQAKELVQKIKNEMIPYSELGFEEIEYGDLKFGYSGSDMDKLLITAIQIASSRALEEGYIMANKFNIVKGTETYYLAVPLKKGKYVILDYVLNKIRGKKLKVLTDEQATRALNFAFCQGDIIAALEKYPSTIIPKDYVDLLLYKYRGRSPEE